jgi:transcriptional regulator with XRE-family HTH domain
MDEETLTSVVRQRIAETGWTLQAIADRAGLSIATVSAFRSGNRGRNPHRETLIRLARGLQIPPERLLTAVAEQRRTDRERELLANYRHLDDLRRRYLEDTAKTLCLEQAHEAALAHTVKRSLASQRQHDDGDPTSDILRSP